LYKIQRAASGVDIYVFRRTESGWKHLFSWSDEIEAKLLLERMAVESLGLTERKQITLGYLLDE
jgi:hypothetical protein